MICSRDALLAVPEEVSGHVCPCAEREMMRAEKEIRPTAEKEGEKKNMVKNILNNIMLVPQCNIS